jgi:putative FmdB family regulatory protein
MPIYEYTCRKCGAHVEALQKLSDKPLAKCKQCGGKLEKQWSATGFQFKGSGWYVTDYARKGGEKSSEGAGEGGTEAKAETKAETKSETTSDSKSEAKTETKSEKTKGDEKKTPKATSTSKGASAD